MRMTRVLSTYLGCVAGLVGAVLAAAALAQPAASDHPRVAVVVAGRAAERPELLADVQAAVKRAHAELRVPRTPTEQLGVTHLLAAGRYDEVIGVGLDRRVAVAPVARRYPHTRFVSAPPQPAAIERELARAAR